VDSVAEDHARPDRTALMHSRRRRPPSRGPLNPRLPPSLRRQRDDATWRDRPRKRWRWLDGDPTV